MKKIAIVNMLIAFVLVLGSCSTSNDVVSNRLISKRKFNKGFHLNKRSHFKGSDGTQEKEVLAYDGDKESKSAKKSTNQKKITSPKSNTARNEAQNSVAEVSFEVNDNVAATSEFEDDVSSNESRAVHYEESENNSAEEQSSKPEKKSKSKKSERKKSSGSGWTDSIFILAVICAILIPPLGVAIYTNIDWMKVLICFLLTCLFVLPGMIYALLVVFDVI